MEAKSKPKPKPKIQIPTIMRRSSSSNSQSHLDDSPHSPLRYHSPRSDAGDPPETSPYASPMNSPGPEKQQPPVDNSNSKAIVAVVDKCTQFTPLPSPLPPVREEKSETVVNRAVREERTPADVRKTGRSAGGGGGGGDAEVAAVLRRSRREETLKVAELGFRVCEVVLCLISFSVMAADKTQGWSGDSFDRYKEYRYCLSMNVIAFVYSGFQAYDLGYRLISGKYAIRHRFRRHFNFFMDQAIAYLLISASSSAATRVDDWVSNWGKDEFTEMASASIAMSFLAFIAFAVSSLISGYNLCNYE